MFQLILLIVFTLILEVLAVACILAVSERKKLMSAIISSIMEPIKIVSLIFVIEGDYRYLSIFFVALACGVGNYFAIYAYEKVSHVAGRRKMANKGSFEKSEDR